MRLFTGLNFGLLTSAAGALLLLQSPAQAQSAKPSPAASKSVARLPTVSSAGSLTHDFQPADDQTAQLMPPAPTLPAPALAQTTDVLIETEPVITPPVPINSQMINERVQGEVEGEIDDVIIRQVPAPELIEQTYQLQVAPVADVQIRADRRSTVKLGGSITDESGEVLAGDVVVTLTASAGEFIGADYDIDRAGFQVLARRGEFEAELRSSLDAQRVVIRASAARNDLLAQTPLALEDNLVNGAREIEAYTEVSFITPLRPSLVTGVVDLRFGSASTNFWGSFSDFLAPDKIDKTELDGRAAVFGTGAIGDWLFTGPITAIAISMSAATKPGSTETCRPASKPIRSMATALLTIISRPRLTVSICAFSRTPPLLKLSLISSCGATTALMSSRGLRSCLAPLAVSCTASWATTLCWAARTAASS